MRLCPDAVEKTGGGTEDAAAEDELFGVEGADQVGHGHAPVDDSFVEDALCEGIVLVEGGKDISPLEFLLRSGAQDAGGCGVRGEILPGDPGEAVAGGMVFEAAAGGVFGVPGLGQPHPADGPGDIVMTAQNAAIDENPGADAGADGEKDGVPAAPRRSLPGLAEDIAGAIAVDADRDGWKGLLKLLEQGIVVPAGNVGRPYPARAGIIDARDADADGADLLALRQPAGGRGDERADLLPLPALQQGAAPAY